MKVRLTRKLAECIDGVDLAGCRVGDVLDLSVTDARLLLAEKWAVVTEQLEDRADKQPDDGQHLLRAS
jgi:hypothetical protein